MAGSRKEYELLFKLQAALGGNFNAVFKGAINTTRQLQNTMQKLNSTTGKIDAFQKQSTALESNRQKLERLTAEHDRLQRELSQTEQPSEKLRAAMERNERQIADTTAKIEAQEARLRTLGDELSDAGVDTSRLAQENERLAKSYGRLKNSQEEIARLNTAIEKNGEAISGAKRKFAGTIGTITALGAAIYAGPVKKSIEFENQMANVSTLLDGDIPAISARVAELRKDIINLSNATGVGTDNLTDGLYQVISAFGDSAESAKLLEIASKAAKAGGATTADSINLLSAVTKGYGDISAEAQQKAADLAFQTVKLGQTSFPELASSMGKVIPLASTLSVKQEDLFGAMSTLTGVTGGTAEVATQLKATMQGFLSPSTNMAKSLEKLGYATGKDLLESKGLQGALDLLKESVGGNELEFAKLFSSVEAQTAVLSLAGEQADNFRNKTTQMYEAGGAAQSAFEKATNTTAAKIERAKTALSNLGLVLADTFLPYVSTAAEKLSVLITNFSAWAQENPKLLSTLVKVGGAVLGLKAAGQAAKIGFLELNGARLTIQKGFEGIRTVFNLARIDSAGFSGTLKGVAKNVIGYFGGIGSAAGGAGRAFSGLFSGTKIGNLFSGIGGAAGGLFSKAFYGIGGLAAGAVKG